MYRSATLLRLALIVALVAAVAALGAGLFAQNLSEAAGKRWAADLAAGGGHSAMNNPYRMLENWPHFGDIKSGSAIGIVPDGKGGVWLQQRSVPSIVHIDAAGQVVKRWDITFAGAHGLCQDRDGNFWAVDSGPFDDSAEAGVKGNQVFKFSPDGKLLLTLGKAGVSKAGPDTFLQPAACVAAPNGDIVIADGHWSRPTKSPQDGDRLVRYTKDGHFINSFGRQGGKVGEFMGPHGLAFDSQGRLFVADRSNNRIQIFDKDMNFVDDWKQFGRPSGISILRDDTLIVSDSESNYAGFTPAEFGLAPIKPGERVPRNTGWKNGIRIGSAKDGSLRSFIPETLPEGLAADELGNIYAGLSAGCETSRSGGCLQKFVRK